MSPGDLFRDKNGIIWKVISIADDPTVELVTINKTMPEHENHVISSRNFAERFPEKLAPVRGMSEPIRIEERWMTASKPHSIADDFKIVRNAIADFGGPGPWDAAYHSLNYIEEQHEFYKSGAEAQIASDADEIEALREQTRGLKEQFDALRTLASELALLLSVEDVIYCDNIEGRKRADWIGNEIGRLLGLEWPEFSGQRWEEPPPVSFPASEPETS